MPAALRRVRRGRLVGREPLSADKAGGGPGKARTIAANGRGRRRDPGAGRRRRLSRRQAGAQPDGADRRPVHAANRRRQDGDRRRFQGPSVPGLFRLHPLPRRLPVDARRHRRRRAQDSRRADPRAVRHRRSRARQPGGDGRLRQQFRLALRRPVRLARTDRGGGEGLSRLRAQRAGAERRRLQHGPFVGRLSDGQERPVRRIARPAAAGRGHGEGAVGVPVRRRARPVARSTTASAALDARGDNRFSPSASARRPPPCAPWPGGW